MKRYFNSITVRTRRFAGGFTMVEMIVVIAIIAILAGMTIPVFTAATDTSTEDYALQTATTALHDNIDYVNNMPLPTGSLFLVDKDADGVVDYAFEYTGDFELQSLSAQATEVRPIAQVVQNIVTSLCSTYSTFGVLMSRDNCLTSATAGDASFGGVSGETVSSAAQYGLVLSAFTQNVPDDSSVTFTFLENSDNETIYDYMKMSVDSAVLSTGTANANPVRVYCTENIDENCLVIIPLVKASV